MKIVYITNLVKPWIQSVYNPNIYYDYPYSVGQYMDYGYRELLNRPDGDSRDYSKIETDTTKADIERYNLLLKKIYEVHTMICGYSLPPWSHFRYNEDVLYCRLDNGSTGFPAHLLSLDGSKLKEAVNQERLKRINEEIERENKVIKHVENKLAVLNYEKEKITNGQTRD